MKEPMKGKLVKKLTPQMAKPDVVETLTVGEVTVKHGDLIDIADQKGTFQFVHVEPGEDGKPDIVRVNQMDGARAKMARFFHAARVLPRPERFR